MEKQNKIVTFRTDLTPLQNTQIAKSKKKIQLIKKICIQESLEKSIEEDLKHENGDPIHFLDSKNEKFEKLGYIKLQKLSKKPTPIINEILKNSLSPVTLKNLSCKNKATTTNQIPEELKIDHDLQIKLIKDRIYSQKLKHSNEKIFSGKERFLRQERSLSRFDYAKNKWNKIENGLMLRSNKKLEELLGMKKKTEHNQPEQKLPEWCTTLRRNPEEKILEFLPVGNKFSGIFVRKVVKNSTVSHKYTNSCPDLSINGLSKLPLEISAVKKAGEKYVQVRKSQVSNRDETLAESYENFRIKKINK